MDISIQNSRTDIILNTYALAKSSWLEDDFVSSFVPMAASLINQKDYETISVDVFATDFSAEYGIKLPSYPAIKLISILQKKGIIIFEERMRLWKPNPVSISQFDLTSQKTNLQEAISSVYEEIVKYSEEYLGEIISDDIAKNLLYGFVQENSAIILNGDLKNYKSAFKDRAVIGSFICHIKEKNVALFETIKQLTIGRVLVDALTMMEHDEASDDFKDSRIYLDTRFFLNLIGFYGDYRETSSVDLIEKLLKKKVNLYIFKHTYDEINYILSGCAKWIDSPSYDPEKASSSLRYLKNCGKDKKYVEALISGMPTRLKRFKIELDNNSWIGNDYSLQISRAELSEIIKKCYENNDILVTERIEETIEYDIASVEAIYYQRKGIETYNISEKNIFLLTTNRNLVYACKKYHDSNFTKNTTPVAISDIFLGTFIWARSGIECCENVVAEKLIADCYTAMEPPQHAINKFCANVAELKRRGEISEAEVIALKCYGLQTQAIKPLLAEPNEYDYKELHEVLEEIRLKTIADEKIKFDKERIYLEDQLRELNEKYGITEQEFIKYRDLAIRYAQDNEAKQKSDLEELLSYAEKAEDFLKVVPNIVNAFVNITIQIALFLVVNPWISIPLRIFVPVFSLFLALALHFNWFDIRDSIKFRLIFSYKKKAENKKMHGNIKQFLSDSKNN